MQATRPSAAEAQEDAAKAISAVLAAVGALGGIDPQQHITTAGVTLSPVHAYDQATHQSSISGYQFQQTLSVQIASLTGEAVGAVVDAAVRAGGDNVQVQHISTDLSPAVRAAALKQAHALAVRDAMETAEVLAMVRAIKPLFLGWEAGLVQQVPAAAMQCISCGLWPACMLVPP